MIKFLTIFFVSLFSISCSKTNFNAESNSSREKKKSPSNDKTDGSIQSDDSDGSEADDLTDGSESNDDGNDDTGGDGLSGDSDSGNDDEGIDGDGDQPEDKPIEDISTETGTVRCLEVENETATNELGSRTDIRNAGRLEINQYVDTTCQANSGNGSISGTAGVVGTPEAAETICRLRGYKSVEESLTDSFSSPKNNQIANWDKTEKRFTIINASSNNIWFGYIKCKQKLKPQCVKNIKVKCG